MYKPRKIGGLTEKCVRDGVRGAVLMHTQDGSNSATNELRKTKSLLDRYDNETKSSRFSEDRDILQSAINHWTPPAMSREELKKSARNVNEKMGLKWTEAADRSFDRPSVHDDWYNAVAGKTRSFDSSGIVKTTRIVTKAQLFEKQ